MVRTFEKQDTPASIDTVSVFDDHGLARTDLPISRPFSIGVTFSTDKPLDNATISFLFYTQDRDLLLYSSSADTTGKLQHFDPGTFSATVHVPASLFNIGNYSCDIVVHNPNIIAYAEAKDIGFEIQNVDNPRSLVFQKTHIGKLALPLDYTIEKR